MNSFAFRMLSGLTLVSSLALACGAPESDADTSEDAVTGATSATKAKAFKKWVSEHGFRTEKANAPDCTVVEEGRNLTGKCPIVISPYAIGSDGELKVTFLSTRLGYRNFDSLDDAAEGYSVLSDKTELLVFRAGFNNLALARKIDGKAHLGVLSDDGKFKAVYKLITLDRADEKLLNEGGAFTPENADFECKSLDLFDGAVADLAEKKCTLVLEFSGVGTEAGKIMLNAFENESTRGVRILGSDSGQAEGALVEDTARRGKESITYKTTLGGQGYVMTVDLNSHQVELGKEVGGGYETFSQVQYK